MVILVEQSCCIIEVVKNIEMFVVVCQKFIEIQVGGVWFFVVELVVLEVLWGKLGVVVVEFDKLIVFYICL